MKKIILSVFIASAINNVTSAQTLFGPEVGLNLTNIKEKYAGASISGTTKPGFKIGIVTDNYLGSNLYLQPGLFFSAKGTNSSQGDKIGINYIEVPINLLYKFKTNTGNYVFVGAGPYFAVAVGGQATSNGYTGKINIGSSETDDVKTFDFGLGFNAGYQLRQGLFFRGQYQFGLVNINPTHNAYGSDATVKNNGFSITVGWLFGDKGHPHKNKKPIKK